MSSSAQSFTPNLSNWLLESDPDLTPDQVWMVLNTEQNGRPSMAAVIADSPTEAMDGMRKKGCLPLMAISERGIGTMIAAAETSPLKQVRNAMALLRGVKKFGVAFSNDGDDSIRLVWVEASDASAAFNMARDLDETQVPVGVVDIRDLKNAMDLLTAVREQRGMGAETDERECTNDEEHWFALAAERLGGQAQFDAQVQAILEMDRRTPRAPAVHG